MKNALTILLLTAAILLVGTADAYPATFVVSSLEDAGPGTLRQAILDANVNGEPDTISFQPGLFASPRTMVLTSGMLDIQADSVTHASKEITILGPGANLLTISGNGLSRVLTIEQFGKAIVAGITIADGNGTGGPLYVNGGGGIMVVGGEADQGLVLKDSVVTHNYASESGGGILAGGQTTLINCAVYDNQSGSYGGGIANFSLQGLYLINSTVARNSSLLGGAISSHSYGGTTVTNSTIAFNVASAADGAIYNGSFTLLNSIIAKNTAAGGPSDLDSASVTSKGHNIIESKGNGVINEMPSDLVGADAGLDPELDTATSPVPFYGLITSSPAIDGGDNCVLPSYPSPCVQPGIPTDIRGVERPQDGDNNGSEIVDVGSYEATGAGYDTAPNTPDLLDSSDTGISTTDNITNLHELTIAATGLTAGATVNLYRSGTLVGTDTAGSANLTFTDTVPSDGTYVYKVRQVQGTSDVPSGSLSVVVDTSEPSATVDQTPGQADPTGSQPITFDVRFSEPVAGFDSSKVHLSGIEGLEASSVFLLGGDTHYTVSIKDLPAAGTVTAAIDAGAVRDIAGNANLASTSTDNSVTFDTDIPHVTVEQAAGQDDPTGQTPVNFTITFTKAVTGFTAQDVSLEGSTADVRFASKRLTGSGTTYNISVSSISSDGKDLLVSVPAGVAFDAAGNLNAASTSVDNKVTVNHVAFQAGSGDHVQKVTGVRDAVYNSAAGILYASRPSSIGADGNSISEINPVTGEIVESDFAGSEPNKLSLSDDGRSLYVGLDGSFSIRRFDTDSMTGTAPFPIAVAGDEQPVYSAAEISVAPGKPERVAVVRSRSGVSPWQGGIAVFDNGVRLGQSNAYSSSIDSATFSSSPAVLYTGGSFDPVRTWNVAPYGISDSGTRTSFNSGKIRVDNGRVYTSTGQVVDMATRSLAGTFPGASSAAFAVDQVAGRAFYAVRDLSSNALLIKAYDTRTFVLLGTMLVPDVMGTPTSLVRYGTNGLAMVTDNKDLFLIQTSLIPTADPLPLPVSTGTPTPTPTPTPWQTTSRVVGITANDLVYDDSTRELIASVPGTSASNGNSITKIDPDSGAINSSAFVGSEPDKLALSDDGTTLYVGIDGSGSVREFDAVSGTAKGQFYLDPAGSNGVPVAAAMDVMPGSPSKVAVSMGGSAVGSTALYDTGVKLPNTANASGTTIQFTSQEELLISPYMAMMRSSVDNAGIHTPSPVGGISSGDFVYAGGVLVSIRGRVMDMSRMSISGTLTGTDSFTALSLDKARDRVYFMSGSRLLAYDLSTFKLIGTVQLPFPAAGTRLVRWGTNGLAYRSAAGIVLVQSKLIDAAAPVPDPTPAASPTPTPTPIETFVRPVDLPANDVVYSSAGDGLYVTLPGAAGAELGNSITRVDPATGLPRGSTFIGSEPGRMAISSDGGTLYAKLDGAGTAVRRFDVGSNTPGIQFDGPSNQIDMKVMPGKPGTVAFATGFSTGVQLYDDGVARPNGGTAGAYGIYAIDFDGPDTIYGLDNSYGYGPLVRFAVDASGVTGTNLGGNALTTGARVAVTGGRIYSLAGGVADTTGHAVGRFASGGTAMCVDAANQRIFFIDGNTLTAYDINTFLKVGSVTIPDLTGTAGPSLVRWGANGLAFRTQGLYGGPAGKLYVLQSSLVSSGGPMPTGVRFAAAAAAGSETGGGSEITVSRSGDLSGVTTVNVSTSDGTAVAGQDYSAVNKTITFQPGDAAESVVIPIFNDYIYEGTETLNVRISDVSGAGSLLSPTDMTVSIIDNEHPPAVLTANTSVDEPPLGASVLVPVTLTLSNPTVQPVSFAYSTEDGSAVAGSDYTPTSGTINFAPLETTKTIYVPVLGDGAVEGSETFSLALSSFVNASPYSAAAVITINDLVASNVGGRVVDPAGHGIRGASVTLTDPAGNKRSVMTSSLGYYSFDSVTNGKTYRLTATSKRYRFAAQSISVTGDMTVSDLVGLE